MAHSQKQIAVVLLLVCLASVKADLVSTVISACTTGGGVGGYACKGAMQMANNWCKRGGNAHTSCVDAAVGLCKRNKQACDMLAGPLCSATGTFATQCSMAVKAAQSPIGGAAAALLG